MTYLLDTNTCIYFLNERSESLVRRIIEMSSNGLKASNLKIGETDPLACTRQ